LGGTSWSRAVCVPADALHGIWGASPEEMFAVGYNGAVLRYRP